MAFTRDIAHPNSAITFCQHDTCGIVALLVHKGYWSRPAGPVTSPVTRSARDSSNPLYKGSQEITPAAKSQANHCRQMTCAQTRQPDHKGFYKGSAQHRGWFTRDLHQGYAPDVRSGTVQGLVSLREKTSLPLQGLCPSALHDNSERSPLARCRHKGSPNRIVKEQPQPLLHRPKQSPRSKKRPTLDGPASGKVRTNLTTLYNFVNTNPSKSDRPRQPTAPRSAATRGVNRALARSCTNRPECVRW
jgi:hypothetical protein